MRNVCGAPEILINLRFIHAQRSHFLQSFAFNLSLFIPLDRRPWDALNRTYESYIRPSVLSPNVLPRLPSDVNITMAPSTMLFRVNNCVLAPIPPPKLRFSPLRSSSLRRSSNLPLYDETVISLSISLV